MAVTNTSRAVARLHGRMLEISADVRRAEARGDENEVNALSAEFNALSRERADLELEGLTAEHELGEHDGEIVVDCDACRDEAAELGIALPA